MLTESEQLVLDHFGLQAKDFPELAKCVDIEAMAKSIRNPTKMAVCNILNEKGDVVVNKKGPARVHVEVTVKNALQILAKKSLRFLKWF